MADRRKSLEDGNNNNNAAHDRKRKQSLNEESLEKDHSPPTKKRSNGHSAKKEEKKEEKPEYQRQVRVYADGIYDLFHFGHARSLEQAKKLFPNTFLIVGVCNDEMTHRLKGKTVMTDKERAESLRHCKWVDEVVEDAPWIVNQSFLDEHQIDYVAHGEDICYDENGGDIYQFVKDQGKYQTIKRTEGISTSDIILRIVKDYDSYVRRNLARGYTRKQMNIGFVKEKQIQVSENLKKFKEKMQDRVNKVQNWSKSHRLLEFVKKFGLGMEKLVGLEDNVDYDSTDSEGGFSPYSPYSSASEHEKDNQEEDPIPHM